jgi:esterase/lipase superfamily enzyme
MDSLQGDQLRSLGEHAPDIRILEQLDSRIDSELRSLRKLKTRPWNQEHKEIISLSEIAERVASITEDIGWHPGEGDCHTKYDMLDYRLARFQSEAEASVLVNHYTEVIVFFGTNRSKAAGDVYYGTDRDSMHYGRCLVSVPIDRQIGKIPRPSIWNLYRENRKKHFIIDDVSERNRDDFTNDLRTYVNACGSRQALVFVHGFNVSFVDAVFRTAQIAADLNVPGTSILFSWPSKGVMSPVGYTHDETQARWTLPDLRAFLEMVAQQSGATTIHLLAHSMGNRALTDALYQIGLSAARKSPAIFNELILTAPDIDADTFTRDIAPVIVPTAKRVTLYASSNDTALKFSKYIHGYNRAGESGDNLVVFKGIDTIDVSSVDTDLIGHFYYGDNRSVLSDMFNLMQGQPAASRFGLRERTKRRHPYWVFHP